MKFEDLTGDPVFDYIKRGLGVDITAMIIHKKQFKHNEARSEIVINVGGATLSYNYGRLKRELEADKKYGV